MKNYIKAFGSVVCMVLLGYLSDHAVAAAVLSTALTADRGSYSFRGLEVRTGDTSAPHDFLVRREGNAPLTRVDAVTHGDFVVTANSCRANRCTVAVAFRPSQAGVRVGDVTLQSGAAEPQIVSLDGGTPIEFPTVATGASSVEWLELPSGTKNVKASVSGPFTVALRPNFTYGSIDGIRFADSAATDGSCDRLPAATCRVYLGIQVSGTAPVGQSSGTVTLSTGVSYALTANVLAVGLSVSTNAIDAANIPVASTSDFNAVSIANDQKYPVTLGVPTVTGPFVLTNGCVGALPPGGACDVNVQFSPTAVGSADGVLTVPTPLGSIVVALRGNGIVNPSAIRISPANVNFAFDAPGVLIGVSLPRTIVISNHSPGAVHVAPLSLPACGSVAVDCITTIADSCAALAPLASCTIELTFTGAEGTTGNIGVSITPANATAAHLYEVPYATPVVAAPGTIAVFPLQLQFPATAYAVASGGRVLTLTNTFLAPVNFVAQSSPDFVVDPGCGPIAPGGGCQLYVHYVPTSGNTQASAQLVITAAKVGQANGSLGRTVVAVTGSSASEAALASPGIAALVEPIDLTQLTISNSSHVPLILAAIQGAGVSVDTTGCPQTLAPANSCRITPTLNGCDEGGIGFGTPCTVSIYSNAASSPDTYTLVGAGTLNAGSLSVSPGVLVFPPTAVGATASAQLVVTALPDDTDDPITFGAVGNTNANFQVDDQCASSLHSQPAFPHQSAVTCAIEVTFSPQRAGFHSGTVTYHSSIASGTILIAGTAVEAGDQDGR